MISKSVSIPILIHEDLLPYGIKKPVTWEPGKAPHVIITGATGSGKTYFSTLLLGKIALQDNSSIFVCDFKGDDDFSFLNGSSQFYRYKECTDGLNRFHELFVKRQSRENTDRDMLILFFDEWAAYLNYVDKKQAEEAKKKLSELLMLGRSLNVHVIISQQRADAQYFSTARDNFGLVIGLGNLSPESKEMLFRDYKKDMVSDRKRGSGYMLTNGTDFLKVIVPTVNDFNRLHETIRQAVDQKQEDAPTQTADEVDDVWVVQKSEVVLPMTSVTCHN